MISAGEGLAIAARGPHGGLRPGRVITISGCATSNRFLRTTVSSGPLPMTRSCGRAARGTACPGTVGSLPRSGWQLCPDML